MPFYGVWYNEDQKIHFLFPSGHIFFCAHLRWPFGCLCSGTRPHHLGEGLWQVEMSCQYIYDNDSGSFDEHTLPNALLRYGFYNGFELQLSGMMGYSWLETDEVKTNGVQDVSLGGEVAA